MKKITFGFFSVGIAGAFSAKMAADNFKSAAKEFRNLGKKHGFEPVVSDGILYSRKELQAFLERCRVAGAKAMVLHTASFTAGEMGQQAAYFAQDYPLPFVIWGVPEPEGGPLTVNDLCCANFMTSIFYSMGVPYKWLWGAPGSAEVEKEIAATAAAARAMTALRNATLVVVGSSRVPGFYGSNFDETAIKGRYGTQVERVPLTEFYKRFGCVAPAKEKAAVRKIKNIGAVCRCGEDDIERSAQAYVALKEMAEEYGAAGLAVRCWPEIRDDLGVDTCLPMGLLGDDGIPCSCEADVPGLLTMIMQYELNGRRTGPPSLLDMVSYDEKKKSVGLWHCGVCSPSLGGGGMTVCRHNIVEQGSPEAKMGLLLELNMKPGPATLCRLQGDAADEYIAAAGEVLKTPPKFRGSYAEFKPETVSAEDLLNTVMTQGVTHHYSLAYSDHLALIDEFAYWLDLEEIAVVPAGERGARFGKI